MTAFQCRLAFRQMLKGVCDGDLLLDSNFNICSNDCCLQRLLGPETLGSVSQFWHLLYIWTTDSLRPH